MDIELVIWYDNRSGITHVCKRNDKQAHLTPTSAADDEKNLIIEMCRQTMNAYGANVDVTDIKKE